MRDEKIKVRTESGQTIEVVVLNKGSEEHTSELQSQPNVVCRLLLEKKKKSVCRCIISYLPSSSRYCVCKPNSTLSKNLVCSAGSSPRNHTQFVTENVCNTVSENFV